MDIIYNCGYYLTYSLRGKHTGKKYVFRKRYVTRVNDKDGEEFLKMTAKDISWCQKNSKTIPPFMKLEDWCTGKEGRYDYKPFKIYNPKEYKKLFSL